MTKHMNIDYNTYPYPHAVVDGAISMDAGMQLYAFADSIPEDTISFKRGGEQQDNMAMHNNSQGNNAMHDIFPVSYTHLTLPTNREV